MWALYLLNLLNVLSVVVAFEVHNTCTQAKEIFESTLVTSAYPGCVHLEINFLNMWTCFPQLFLFYCHFPLLRFLITCILDSFF